MSPEAKLGVAMGAFAVGGGTLNVIAHRKGKPSTPVVAVVGALAGLGALMAYNVIPRLVSGDETEQRAQLGRTVYQALPPGGYVAPFTRWPFGAYRFW